MAQRDIYQTLEDRNNIDFVENNGPFCCKRTDAWLGKGFYFWEYHIENAHWWGEKSYRNNYIVCKANYVFDNMTCYDLVDNYENRTQLREIEKKLAEDDNYPPPYTVPRIIAYMKYIGIFHYQAIRIVGEQVKKVNSTYSKAIPFQSKSSTHYYETIPPIQVCFYDKGIIMLDQYAVVYSKYFDQDYCV